ncbi:hypothetical protein RIR_jg21500.t1 [Rhizophagus irregularis DAOM 181602=DAOM 197198]|nr:hypothetical protein RIR_jg21500.t1 [Rhizophagus irregularis DAOM 181602=DAOM 197198]
MLANVSGGFLVPKNGKEPRFVSGGFLVPKNGKEPRFVRVGFPRTEKPKDSFGWASQERKTQRFVRFGWASEERKTQRISIDSSALGLGYADMA